ncbi:unnamed protein product [Effrenium voratum]|uniref:Uncharacterized protein n=1 Tax=Effrenium voratum TaxID=2562239 RepID=A0AA36IUK6_9DINO|nr:unnamed protein product [Effrenium voratum]
MVSFAQPSFWQIKYLVNSLSKKNQKTSLTELHNLIAAFGYDAQVFYLRVLLESVPTTQQAGGKGSTQLLVLSSELKDMENEEQFGQVLCQAIADYKESITEEFLQTLCKAGMIDWQRGCEDLGGHL